jgi:hypothetical protein
MQDLNCVRGLSGKVLEYHDDKIWIVPMRTDNTDAKYHMCMVNLYSDQELKVSHSLSTVTDNFYF